ncbi:astacin [Teladorsagia circumcincta]|uniref:Astacin n=1 Tax=Teladorsagia circumcincta TaxID=45464 RepID=A0A2G9TSU7_TELCI|nr:astacin [Teladorsagia circumcincta]
MMFREQRDQIAEDISRARSKRQAYNDKTYTTLKWSNGVAYMLFELDEETKSSFKKAAKLWMDDTCINFTEYNPMIRPKPPKPEHYLLVIKGPGCSSDLGRKSDWDKQFERQTTETNNNYNLTYDYGSVMHYGSSSVTANKRTPVMVAKDKDYTETLGSDIISFYDLLMMNMLYNCVDTCKAVDTKCQNDGFPHPRDCSKCICPSGYGGKLCETRPEGCGSELVAEDQWNTLEAEQDGSKASDQRDGFMRCNYWIKAPDDRKVEVEILELRDMVAVDGCKHAGVEIKTHSDKRLTGYRKKCVLELKGLSDSPHFSMT